jgi:hypothetical protein
VIVGLALTISCSEHKLLVLPDWELPIRPSVWGDGSGAPGIEIVAGWEKPYSKYFDYGAGMLSWTDGHDVFVGSDFAHGVGLGLANPPERWMSDEGGIYWTTHEHELWTAGRQRGARVIWRFKGAAYDLALGPTAAYLVIAPAGYRKRRASTSLSSSARAISHVTPAAAARLMYSPIAPFDTPVDAEIWRWLRPRSNRRRRISRTFRMG